MRRVCGRAPGDLRRLRPRSSSRAATCSAPSCAFARRRCARPSSTRRTSSSRSTSSATATSLFEVARESGIEGIVGKRADSLYRPGIRSPDWVKIKSWLQPVVRHRGLHGRPRPPHQPARRAHPRRPATAAASSTAARSAPASTRKPCATSEERLRPLEVEDLPARRHPQDLRTRHLGQTRARLRSPLRRVDPRRHPPPPRLPNPPPRPNRRRQHPRHRVQLRARRAAPSETLGTRSAPSPPTSTEPDKRRARHRPTLARPSDELRKAVRRP